MAIFILVDYGSSDGLKDLEMQKIFIIGPIYCNDILYLSHILFFV